MKLKILIVMNYILSAINIFMMINILVQILVIIILYPIIMEERIKKVPLLTLMIVKEMIQINL